jgi:hypothetical protein
MISIKSVFLIVSIAFLSVGCSSKTAAPTTTNSPRLVSPRPNDSPSQPPKEQPLTGKVDEHLTLVPSEKLSYSGQWLQVQFPQHNYHHTLNLMFPATWKFDCCGDMDTLSVDYTYPASSEGNLRTFPSIALYDFGLVTCTNGKYSGCSLDELQKVTVPQFMTSLINYLAANGGVYELKSLKQTGTIRLLNFTTDILVYTGVTSFNQPVDFYLMQTPIGVAGIAFQQPQSFDASLVIEFLNRITPN